MQVGANSLDLLQLFHMDHKPFYVVGNWKSHKTVAQAADWFKEFEIFYKKQPVDWQKLTVVICPAYIHLMTLASHFALSQLPLQLGLQDISAYPSGAYTGQVSAEMVNGLARFSLIGHSERRKYEHEEETLLGEKVKRAKEVDIEPIYCVQSEDMVVPQECEIVAYEPVWAIGTGKPDTPDNADRVASIIRQRNPHVTNIIYGGSVTPENVASYVRKPQIGGVLPGGASLTARTFYQLLVNATRT